MFIKEIKQAGNWTRLLLVWNYKKIFDLFLSVSPMKNISSCILLLTLKKKCDEILLEPRKGGKKEKKINNIDSFGRFFFFYR